LGAGLGEALGAGFLGAGLWEADPRVRLPAGTSVLGGTSSLVAFAVLAPLLLLGMLTYIYLSEISSNLKVKYIQKENNIK
jgi:hypothetical protein